MGTAYEDDVIAWSAEQASLLRAGQLALVDIEHIADEIENIGSEKKFALQSLFTKITVCLFMLEFSPAADLRNKRIGEIASFRTDAIARMDDAPSLKHLAGGLLERAWKYASKEIKARFSICNEGTDVPSACPYTVDQVIDMEFVPDGMFRRLY